MPILDYFESDYINDVSETDNGLMSANDKIKLDNIKLESINNIYSSIDEINEYRVPQFIYGIKIDPTVSNPNNAVTYTDDAVGFIPLKVNQTTGECNYGSWKNVIDNVFNVKPCLIKKDGTIITYLDKDNYAMTEGGNVIDIESGDYGQVMIRFRHIYYKFSTDGDKLWFRISNKRTDSTWVDYAFAAEDGTGTIKKEMFIAAYESGKKNNTLQSISNILPSFNLDYSGVEECSSFGVFNMMNIVRKEFIMLLGYLVTKSIDLDSNIGTGNTKGDILKTGTMNDKGLFYGKSDNVSGVKLFGIENLWGNQLEYMHGILQKLTFLFDKNGNYIEEQHVFVKRFYPYNNIDDFDDIGKITPNTEGYISSLKFTTDCTYFPDKLTGSSNTYFKSYFKTGKSKSSSNKLYGIYGGSHLYGDKSGSEFLLLANLTSDDVQVTTHIIY